MSRAPLVAILDDEPEIRRMLALALEEAGFQTTAFGRATEFEAALKRRAPDVCLVDLACPTATGWPSSTGSPSNRGRPSSSSRAARRCRTG